MNAPLKYPIRTADAAAQFGHNGGPDMEAERLFEIIGPRSKSTPAVFQCGAPWTRFASDAELKRLGVLEGRLTRLDRRAKEIRKERTKVMMRCVRRMRRERGVE